MATRGIDLAQSEMPQSLKQQGLTHGDIVMEFNYLLALATRFECESYAEFERADRALSGDKKPKAGNARARVREIRSFVERATLHMAVTLHSLASARYPNEARFWPRLDMERDFGTRDEVLSKAADLLLAASDRLATLPPIGDEIAAAALTLLEKQYRVNVICAYNLYAAASLEPSVKLRDAAEAALQALLDEDLSQANWIIQLNVSAFRVLINDEANANRAVFETAAREITNLHDTPHTKRVAAASDYDLSRVLAPVMTGAKP
jgi:hypothetical protein